MFKVTKDGEVELCFLGIEYFTTDEKLEGKGFYLALGQWLVMSIGGDHLSGCLFGRLWLEMASYAHPFTFNRKMFRSRVMKLVLSTNRRKLINFYLNFEQTLL